MPDEFGPHAEDRRLSHTRLLLSSALAAGGQGLALAAVFFPAWTFGGVLPRSLIWLFPLLGAAWICWFAAERVGQRRPPFLSVITLVLLLAMALAGLQLVPVDSATLARLSPGGARFRAALLAPAPGIAGGDSAAPVSLEPAATRRDLATLVLVAGAFVTGAALFAGDTARRRLCLALAVQGALVAFFALTQLLRMPAETSASWRIAFHSDSWFGPFINRNNEGGYLNLCLGGALALLLWTMRHDDDLPEASGPHLSTTRDQLVQFLLRPFAHLRASVLFALSMCGLIVAEIFCSLSRGAIVSMIGGLALAVLLAVWTRRNAARLWPLAFALAAGVALVAWLGGGQRVRQRLESLFTPAVADLGRISHWRDAVQAVPDFWPAGSGLGTYRRVYTAYQHRNDIYWYHHAENQPLESLIVGGVGGLTLLLAAAGLTIWAARRAWLAGRAGWPSDFALAMVFLLTAQYLQSLVDFGLCLPANALAFALVAGALCGRPAAGSAPARSGWRRVASGATLLLLCGAAVWGWSEIRRAAAVDNAYNATRAATNANQPRLEETEAALARLQTAVQRRPDDADGQFQTAVLYVQAYRAAALAQMTKEYPAVKPEKLNELTTLVNLFRSAEEFRRTGNKAALEQLRRQPLVRQYLAPAEHHAILARNACPNMPEPHLLLAQLSVLRADGDPGVHLRRVELAAPSYGPLLHRCACLELLAGNVDEACRVFRLAIASDEDYLAPQALAACEGVLTPDQIVKQVLPDSPRLLVRLARDYARLPLQARLRQVLYSKAETLLAKADLPEAERLYLQGVVCHLDKRYYEASQTLTAAVKRGPREWAWRFELAQVLFRQGRLDEALAEAELCYGGEPRNSAYRILVEQIHAERLRGPIGPAKLPKP